MSKRKNLTTEEVKKLLKDLIHWQLEDGYLKRKIEFKNFKEAFKFMTKVAELAERLDHHPDWSNSYNVVDISLKTHSENAITELDQILALEINKCTSNV